MIAARGAAERRLAAAQRELDRTVDALVRGLITEDEAEAHLPKLRAEHDRVTTESARTPEPPKVVALHRLR